MPVNSVSGDLQRIDQKTMAELVDIQISFHGKLYQMTGNTTMQRFQDMLLPIFGYVVELKKTYTPRLRFSYPTGGITQTQYQGKISPGDDTAPQAPLRAHQVITVSVACFKANLI